ncbi:cytochrome c oxidase assembly factor CtaG [Anoxybacillus ayderensis]|uniref:cytochrome c oxidase assembly factor CtaG n=1 Tax=Anoxybacillus ayderensis TaxID=265546 RepID=UPI000A269057|nr:cytochrome c oxidase assembly factor CtaG [Anoxybacillus ayderensis]MED0656602.1 cytochrome c oxidase assembly factor CtaG [Anoxybacillus ayderensis]OSX55197.1 cytochrome c oxidase assembly factor CtaG [Anoxybacillus ayderensis]
MMPLSIFGFEAMWSPYFFMFLVAVTIAYFWFVNRAKEQTTTKQKTLFVTAIVLLYICKGSPVDLLGHLMFSVHMTQMAVLYLMVPPLLIKGIPSWMFEALFRVRIIRSMFTFFTKPLIALFLFNGIFSLYHVPLIFDVVKTNMWLHAFMTIAIFIAAMMMWWPLVNEVRGFPTLSGLKKMGYIFADGVLLTPACALIIFADTPLYATYYDPAAWINALALCVPQTTLASLELSGPEMFSSMSLLHDQQLGGVLMKIIQEIVYGVMLFFIFMEWYRKERNEEHVAVQTTK